LVRSYGLYLYAGKRIGLIIKGEGMPDKYVMITASLTTFFVFISIWYMRASFKKRAIYTDENVIILKMNIISRIVSIVLIIFTICLGVIVSLGTIKSISDFIIASIIIIIIGSIGLFLYFVSNIRVEIDDIKIKYFGMTGKIKEVEWEKIKKVEFNRFHKRWILKSNDVTVNIDLQLIGVLDFLEKMKEKIDESIYKDEYFKFKFGR
jgi:hypothetical protein